MQQHSDIATMEHPRATCLLIDRRRRCFFLHVSDPSRFIDDDAFQNEDGGGEREGGRVREEGKEEKRRMLVKLDL